MTKDSLFLDTSIQISRLGYDEDRKLEIENFIKNYKIKATSCYARLEFKQSYIQDLIYLHRVLTEEESFSRTLYRVRRLTASLHNNRKIGNVLEQLCLFFLEGCEFVENQPVDIDLADQCRNYIELMIDEIWERFEESVDYLSDNLNCIPSKEPPQKKKLTYQARIKKSKSQKCDLRGFILSNEKQFQIIKKHIDSLSQDKKKKPQELERISKTIEDCFNNIDVICDGKHCLKLGDALIAVEALKFKELYTKDIDQNNVIAKALKLKSSLLN